MQLIIKNKLIIAFISINYGEREGEGDESCMYELPVSARLSVHTMNL